MDDLVPSLKSMLPRLRGRLLANEPLAPLTWFRVGGPAQALFMPEDESDLAHFLGNLPREIPVTVIGLGSNLIIRDGGVAGAVIRLGRGFSEVAVEERETLQRRLERGNNRATGTPIGNNNGLVLLVANAVAIVVHRCDDGWLRVIGQVDVSFF